MRRSKPLAVVCGGALAAAMVLGAPRVALGAGDCGACPAGPPVPASTLYQLLKESSFEMGCLAPCECPVLIQNGLVGSFVLTPLRSGPLFDEYLVCQVDWTVPAIGSNPALHVTGNGWYRVGGEVAVQHELKLCVSVNGGEPQRLESGLVGGGGFPRIDIAVAAHGFFCWDTVMAIKSAPVSAGVPPDASGTIGLWARPNPSTGSVDLDLFLAQAGPITLRVLDVQGREVRVLDDAWRHAGPHAMRWDGMRRDGSRAPAGLYLLRLQAGGLTLTRRLVRL